MLEECSLIVEELEKFDFQGRKEEKWTGPMMYYLQLAAYPIL